MAHPLLKFVHIPQAMRIVQEVPYKLDYILLQKRHIALRRWPRQLPRQ
jgi:hypothetical protein